MVRINMTMETDLRRWIRLIEGNAPASPRGASLYHGTSCFAATAIITSGFLEASSDGHGTGVSLTDAWGSAEEFALRKDSEDAAFLAHQKKYGDAEDYEEDFYESMKAFPHLGGVVFELDTAKLVASHRIRAVDYVGDWEIEEEWRVMTKTGIIINPILKAVHVKPAVIAWWIAEQPDRKAMLQKLLNHPLRR